MREKKTFAKRTKIRTTDEVNKKYFLVYEGSDTEDLYFEGIQEQRQKVGIDPLIELVPIVRSYSEEGWSNPKKILDRMLQYLQESDTGVVSYETLMNWIMDYLYEEEILTTSKVESRNMWETLKWICQEKLHVSESDIVENLNETCKQFAVYFKEASTIDALVDNVPRIIHRKKCLSPAKKYGIIDQSNFHTKSFLCSRRSLLFHIYYIIETRDHSGVS